MSDDFELARERFAQGVRAFESGALTQAEAHFAASLTHLPGRPSALMNLAAVRIRLGQTAQALPLLEQALAQEPDNADAWGHRAAALAALGRPEEALAACDRVLALAPGRPAALFQRGIQLNAIGRAGEALAAFDALLMAQPDEPEALFHRAQTLHRLGRADEALAAYERLLARQPEVAIAWTQRGSLLKDLGRGAEAAACFRRALAQGGDEALNRFLLASLEDGKAPPGPPREYVEGLFDAYAADFDEHLAARLGYDAPRRLVALLPREARFDAALDLGCGTGLMAPWLLAHCDAIDGVDLSARMLEKARALGRYRQLHHADLLAHLTACREGGQRYGLVAAADVFVYVGVLDAVFAGVSRVLDPGGAFLFTVEAADAAAAGDAPQLRPNSRYAHPRPYLDALATRHGFQARRAEACTLRHDQGRPVAGWCLWLERIVGPAPHGRPQGSGTIASPTQAQPG